MWPLLTFVKSFFNFLLILTLHCFSRHYLQKISISLYDDASTVCLTCGWAVDRLLRDSYCFSRTCRSQPRPLFSFLNSLKQKHLRQLFLYVDITLSPSIVDEKESRLNTHCHRNSTRLFFVLSVFIILFDFVFFMKCIFYL